MSRRPLAALAAAALALTLAACGSSAADAPTATASGSTEEGAFPVTVEHTFGETTIDAEPQRVVSIGFNEQDFALALGVTPVGVREFLGYDATQRPWAQDLLPADPLPTVGAEELDLEAVAALEPDLILGVYSFIDSQTYEQLSEIAPTIAESADFPEGGTPWQEQTLMTGRALGVQDDAQALVDEVEGTFAEVVEANPDFAGQTLALDLWFPGHYVLDGADLRARFFTDLGFETPETTGELSDEAVDALDQDVLVVLGADEATLSATPVFAGLGVVTEDRTVFAGDFGAAFPNALGFGSPLSLPYALELITPALAAAADADPATPVPAV